MQLFSFWWSVLCVEDTLGRRDPACTKGCPRVPQAASCFMQLWQQGSICEPVDNAHGKQTHLSVSDTMVFPVPLVSGSSRSVAMQSPPREKSHVSEPTCAGSWNLLKAISFLLSLASQSFLCHMPWQNGVSCVKVEQLFYIYIHLQGLFESLEVFWRLWGSNWYLTEELQLANTALGKSIYLNLLDACQELTALWGLATAPKLSLREFIRISLLCVCKFIFCLGLSIHSDIILDFFINQPPIGEWRNQQEVNCII